MKLKNEGLKAVSAALALTGGIGGAQATPVVISETVPLGSLLANGQSVSGLFDINALVVGAGITPGNYDVLSAQAIGYGYSDILYNINSYQGTMTDSVNSYSYSYQAFGGYYAVYYAYGCGWFSTCYGVYYVPYYYTIYVYNYDIYRTNNYQHQDTGATMSLNAGGDVGTGSASQVYSNTVVGSYYYQGNTYNGSGYNYYYDRTSDSYLALYGALTAPVTLGSGALDDLEADGLLGFSVGSTLGQFTANLVTLQATIEQRVAAANSESVPEPGTLASVAAGLLGLLAARRRKIRPT